MPSVHGEDAVIRILDKESISEQFVELSLNILGWPEEEMRRFRKYIREPYGMVLVTGPTGSGKTTTLYAALSELNTTERNIVTVEDPVEYRLPGINQVQVNEKIDLTFDRVLRSALRQDPDVVLVGEMRDRATVETGLRAAMTGHLVFSTLHTNDAASTPIRLLDMGAPRYMVAYSLQMVLAQRLLRMVCESCAADHKLMPHERLWLKHELGDEVDGHTYKHGKGCSHCNGTGYLGRSGVYEMLEMTRPVVDAADREDTGVFIEAARQQMAGKTLSWYAARLAAAGKTTAEEAMRVSTQVDD
jgi:MSHA biogenesis protein MshE